MQNEQRDEQLWRQAKKRAAFKYSLATYLIVNLFLIGIWYFTGDGDTYFWPAWSMLGWGMGIAFQYYDAYHGNSAFSAEAEYNKLKNKQSQQ